MAQPARTTSFSSILDQESSGTVDRPKPLPVGTYVCVIKGLPEQTKSKTGTEGMVFIFQPLKALDDVDEEALTEMGGLTNRTLRNTYWITEDAKWRMDKLFEDIGVLEEGKSRRQMISEAPGQQVLVSVKHTASEDGETTYANIGSTAAID